jgi:hypothetical protein
MLTFITHSFTQA